ncbi:MAG: sulfite exporter TauE/SafE family protein [Gammaproteobacteria bacterium]|nr:sulfite exporter TauE/SafE family protein [Gammaproteobacteria bacterium]
MIEPLSYLTAFLLGLFGSIHCMGMCGGIVGALALNTQHPRPFSLQLGYHLGRITTYGLIGLLAGFIGLWLASTHEWAGLIMRTLSGVLLVLMGLYVLGTTSALIWLEKIGAYLWKWVQPFSKHVLPTRTFGQSVTLGLIWGLLPCGLVYSTLSWALVSANPIQSSTLMMVFGLGNLPALLSLAAFTTQLNQFKRHWLVRMILAGCIIAFGLWTAIAPWFAQ